LNLHVSPLQQFFNFCLAAFRANANTHPAQPGYPLQVRPQHIPSRFGPRLNEGSRKAELSATIPGRVCTFSPSFVFQSTKFLPFIFFILLACGKPLPTFENLDIAKWKEDKAACGKVRLETMEELTRQKDKLKGLSQDDIVELLGRPDQNELYKRNQKFFYYLLSPGKACGSDSTAHRLSLRFNAMGFAKEVMVE
jgi:hypothetical protein